jgi:hypothetical protein
VNFHFVPQVDPKKRDSGGDEWETVGSTKAKGKPVLKVVTKGGWGKGAAAPLSAPAATQRSKSAFDFGDEQRSDEEDDDEEEVEAFGSKSTGASPGVRHLEDAEAVSPVDEVAELFELKFKKRARGLLDELYSCHLLQEAVELLVEMVLPLDMTRPFVHLCVGHCIARCAGAFRCMWFHRTRELIYLLPNCVFVPLHPLQFVCFDHVAIAVTFFLSGKSDAVDLTHEFLSSAGKSCV